MAVHDLGYRGWDGSVEPSWHRPLVIASAGIRRAWQVGWLRRMIFFAFLPALWFGLGFFLWEQALLNKDVASTMGPFFETMPGELADEIHSGIEADNPIAARHGVWAWLLLTFFRTPQAVMMVLVVGLIAPALISQDIRSRAFLLYFSRPISRLEYLLGKFFTVWFYLAAISTIPALCLYLLGILLSPHMEVVTSTWDLPLRILGASAVLAVPTAAISLCLSSLTQESRYAAFGWFAIWILGWFTYATMTAAEAFKDQPLNANEIMNRWSLVSPYHMLSNVQSWIFGFADFHDVRYAALILVVITVVSMLVLAHKVTAPMRA